MKSPANLVLEGFIVSIVICVATIALLLLWMVL
jgi:hypothetical protein